MPQRYEPWCKNLKRIQDLLGEVHDMDVLRSEIRRQRAKLPEALVLQWYQKIEEARKMRLDEFRSNRRKRNQRHQRLCKPFEQRGRPLGQSQQGIAVAGLARRVSGHSHRTNFRVRRRAAASIRQLTQHSRRQNPAQFPFSMRRRVFQASDSRLFQSGEDAARASYVRDHQIQLRCVPEAHHFLGAHANHFLDDVGGISGGLQRIMRADFLRERSPEFRRKFRRFARRARKGW